jgi:[ribosomal protein S18]-alanine N-acetyltransferase
MPTPPFEIRRAGVEDLDDLERLERECFDEATRFSRRQLRDLLGAPSARAWVLIHEGSVAADAVTLLRPGTQTARIYTLAASTAHRGKGFGKALMKACVDDLRSDGAKRIVLEVSVENAGAIRLYESLGFQKIERLVDYYAPGQDAWKMRLEFGE